VKVLLDENLDRRLRTNLDPHQVFTAGYKGWSGVKNGRLLKAAEDDGFDVLVTGDQTLPYEQNLGERHLAVVVLFTVEWRLLRHHLPKIWEAVTHASPGSVQEVHCGVFSRKRKRIDPF
jgi:hypothetical protein